MKGTNAMKRIASFAALTLLCTAHSPAQAQTQRMNMLCAERGVIVAALTDRFGEQVHGMGLAHQNRIVEVYVSEETGTWTITVTSADGTTCLMAAGQHFAQMEPIIPGEDL
jgi:cation diffusion facilitator CzcD-associated flavoprotein CzcO